MVSLVYAIISITTLALAKASFGYHCEACFGASRRRHFVRQNNGQPRITTTAWRAHPHHHNSMDDAVIASYASSVSGKTGEWNLPVLENVINTIPTTNRYSFSRKSWLEQTVLSASTIFGFWMLSASPRSSCWADDKIVASAAAVSMDATTTMDDESSSNVFVRQGTDYGYSIRIPKSFEQTQKPLKTHLDEINFVSSSSKGYQIGITVDPVRINSLRQFGSPEEVAAKVVLAEVNRDGVLDVTLVKDPVELPDGGYVLDYLSQGKRGDKHYVVKIEIQRQKLYVLTTQAPEEIYQDVASEMIMFVQSFRLQ